MGKGRFRRKHWLLIAVVLIHAQSACREAEVNTARPAKQLKTDTSQSRSGFLRSGKFRLGYRIEGEGTPALVVGSSIYYPRTFSQTLRSDLRLAFVDHRGFCPPPDSPPNPRTDYELERLIDDMELARKELDLGRVVVIGHSGHSFMALEYAKKYPENVSHVVMIGIGPDISDSTLALAQQNWQESASPERKAIMEEKLVELPDEELAKLQPDEAYVQRYVRNSPRIWHDPLFDCSPFWKGMSLNTEMLNYVWGVLFRDIDITQGLEGLDRPVFLALGRYDFLVPPPSVWEPFRPKFEDLTIQVFESSGHTPQYEEAELFDRVLLDWIKEKSGER